MAGDGPPQERLRAALSLLRRAAGSVAAGCLAYNCLKQARSQRSIAAQNPKLTVTEDGVVEGEQASAVMRFLIAPLLVTIDQGVWAMKLGPLRQVWTLAKRGGKRGRAYRQHQYPGGASPVFRSAEVAGGELLVTPTEGVRTLWDACARAHDRFADRPALSVRPLEEVKSGADVPGANPANDVRIFGPTKWHSFGDVGRMARAFGSGLRTLNLEGIHATGAGFDGATGPCKLMIWEDTCMEWLVAAQGAFSQSITVATAYATLGVDAVVDAVNEGRITAVLCNMKNVEQLAKMRARMPSLETIIYTKHLIPSHPRCHYEDSVRRLPGAGVRAVSFEDVMASGVKATDQFGVTPPAPEDIAVLMYTSGSTGKPKGVKVSHAQLLASLGAVKERLGDILGGTEEAGLGYLPLAHIFEMAVEFHFFAAGTPIGYADPISLMTDGAKLGSRPHGALDEFRPTLLAGVPKIWELVAAGVKRKAGANSAGKAHLFALAVWHKLAAVQAGRTTPVFDAVVFAKTKAALGGRCKLCVSGGGALSPAVQEFLRCVLCCNVVQGYGLTETCAGGTIQHSFDVRKGCIGPPVAANEILLHSEPDLTDEEGKPYMSTDTVHVGEPCLGRGEVWIRGNNVTSGYYKMPEKTSEDYWPAGTPASDQFFKTGDVAIWLPDGSLRIVDRKKNLVKLKGGEYVRIEQMNQAFNTSPYVNPELGCCAYADADMDRSIALVQPNMKALEEFARGAGIAFPSDAAGSRAALAANKQVLSEVKDSLIACGKKQGLTALEKIVGVAILTDDWSTANGCLTATLKLVPNGVKRFNKKEIDAAKRAAGF